MSIRPFIDSHAKIGRPRTQAHHTLVKRKKEKVTFEIQNKDNFKIIIEEQEQGYLTKRREIKVTKRNIRLLTNWLLEVCFEPRWNRPKETDESSGRKAQGNVAAKD